MLRRIKQTICRTCYIPERKRKVIQRQVRNLKIPLEDKDVFTPEDAIMSAKNSTALDQTVLQLICWNTWRSKVLITFARFSTVVLTAWRYHKSVSWGRLFLFPNPWSPGQLLHVHYHTVTRGKGAETSDPTDSQRDPPTSWPSTWLSWGT